MNDFRHPRTEPTLLPLEPGDYLDQKTFHARYEAMPSGTRAELIGGVVLLHGRTTARHGRMLAALSGWLSKYETATADVEAFGHPTTILNGSNEVQPDACLLLRTSNGGQTRDEDEYIVGPPELIVEVASGSESIELHRKREEYERAGVREYLAVALRQGWVYWFAQRDGYFVELDPGPEGLLRSEVFPGLWLDPAALLRHDSVRMLEVLRQGLASREHAAFVARLAGGRGGQTAP